MYEDYYHWLVGLLGDDSLEDNYQKLLHKLFEREFTWIIDFDSNRAEDGLYLRRIYSREIGQEFLCESPCSVLEMLVALSMNCESLMYDQRLGDRSYLWFRDILHNLGLDKMDDYSFSEDYVDEIIDNFLERRYDHDGFGGPFYVRNAEIDFRTCDLWRQANLFLVEKYPIF